MGEYLISVVLFASVLSFISFISYPGAHERATRLASAVLLLYGVSMPIVSFLSSPPSFEGELPWEDGYSPPSSDAFYETAEEAFEEGIARLIVMEYGASREDVAVRAHGFDAEEMRARLISVRLSGRSAALDYRGIENYITEQGLGECEVFISFG